MKDLSRRERMVLGTLKYGRDFMNLSMDEVRAIYATISNQINCSDYRKEINSIVRDYINNHYILTVMTREPIEEVEVKVKTTLYNEKIFLQEPRTHDTLFSKSYRTDEWLIWAVDEYIDQYAKEKDLYNRLLYDEIEDHNDGIDWAWINDIYEYLFERIGREYSESYLNYLEKNLEINIREKEYT